jgi:flagellar basal body-associated protein FliL
MLEFLKRRLSSEKGAMDKIIVTLLLVIVGVGAVVGLTTWLGTQTDAVQSAATTKIEAVTNETTGTTTGQ